MAWSELTGAKMGKCLALNRLLRPRYAQSYKVAERGFCQITIAVLVQDTADPPGK